MAMGLYRFSGDENANKGANKDEQSIPTWGRW